MMGRLNKVAVPTMAPVQSINLLSKYHHAQPFTLCITQYCIYQLTMHEVFKEDNAFIQIEPV